VPFVFPFGGVSRVVWFVDGDLGRVGDEP